MERTAEKKADLGMGWRHHEGLLSFGIPLLSSLWIMPLMWALWKYCQCQGEGLVVRVRRDNILVDAVLIGIIAPIGCALVFIVSLSCINILFEIIIGYNYYVLLAVKRKTNGLKCHGLL